MAHDHERVNLMEIFERRKAEGDVVRVCAPMVRYSKLPFRDVVRKHGTDIVFTPMIVSESFVKSQKAREVEFSTNAKDRPLVVQFAASNGKDFADAAEYISPYADAVDLNCGCPQRWAMGEGYGAHLVTKPELVQDMVNQARNRVNIPVTIKIRILLDNDRHVVDLVQRAERMGAYWITVHGRTYKERTTPVHYDKIKLVKDSVQVPVIANGDIFTLDDAYRVRDMTGVDGVMSARGILANPGLFDGSTQTTKEVIQEFVDSSMTLGTHFSNFHHHLMYMTDTIMSRTEKRVFYSLSSTPSVLQYLHEKHGIQYNPLI